MLSQPSCRLLAMAYRCSSRHTATLFYARSKYKRVSRTRLGTFRFIAKVVKMEYWSIGLVTTLRFNRTLSSANTLTYTTAALTNRLHPKEALIEPAVD